METKFKLKHYVLRLDHVKEYLDAGAATNALPEICQIYAMTTDPQTDCPIQYKITRNVGVYYDMELLALADVPRYIALYVDAKAALQTWRTRHAIDSLNRKSARAIDHYISYAVS